MRPASDPLTPSQPTVSQQGQRLRLAALLNVVFPGAGQLFLGQRKLGTALLILFLLPFFASLVIYLVGVNEYLSLAGDENLLEGNKLEQSGGVYHAPWLIALAIIALLVFVTSMVLLWLRPPMSSGPGFTDSAGTPQKTPADASRP